MTTPNATMEGQYGFVDHLVSVVPELATLVKQASAQGATPQAFAAMLQNTDWWRANSDNARTYLAMQASDPTTYGQHITAAQNHVRQMAGQLGINLSDAQVANYATIDLFQGLDDTTLRAQMGSNYTAQSQGGGTSTGDIASYKQSLQSLAADYGVPTTSTWTDSLIQRALDTGQSQQQLLEGARASLIDQASSAYPTLSAQLKAGRTVHDIAQPYIASMAQTLEIPDQNIGITDPTIQKALTNSGLVPPTGKAAGPGDLQPGPTSMPLWQFQNQLRTDPRWQQTDNAKSSAYSMVANLGKQWGFST